STRPTTTSTGASDEPSALSLARESVTPQSSRVPARARDARPPERPVDRTVRRPYTRPMRAQRLELRLTDDERSLDAAAASAVGETLSDFFRRAARARAEEVLADQRDIVLTEEDATRFLDALETPDPDTVARLRELRD